MTTTTLEKAPVRRRAVAIAAACAALFTTTWAVSPAHALTGDTGSTPIAATSDTKKTTKSVTRAETKHYATVAAATYAQARLDGANRKKAARAAANAVDRNRTPYSFLARTIAFGPGRGALSFDAEGTGISYCINIDFTALDKGYTPTAVSKPLARHIAGGTETEPYACSKI